MCKMLEALSEQIGVTKALSLLAFFENTRTIYVPGYYEAGHLLERIVGTEAFLKLIASFGYETISLPAARFNRERRTGLVFDLHRRGTKISDIALIVRISERRVYQLVDLIESSQPLTPSARRGTL